MNETKIRGLVDDDDKAFGLSAIPKLKIAQDELHFLLNRGYPMKSAMTFVGNHHQLTVRQALAVIRATASLNNLALRKDKQLDQPVSNSGRLKAKIYEINWPMPVTVEITHSPDSLLKKLPCVITGDSIILDECAGWFNLSAYIIDQTGLSRSLTRLIQLNGETKP